MASKVAFTLKAGDTMPPFVGECLRPDGSTIPTLGATPRFRMTPQVPGLRAPINQPAKWSGTPVPGSMGTVAWVYDGDSTVTVTFAGLDPYAKDLRIDFTGSVPIDPASSGSATLPGGPGAFANLIGSLTPFTAVLDYGLQAEADFVVGIQRTVLSAPVPSGLFEGSEATYAWQTGDTATPGLYNAEFAVTFVGGAVETFPNGEYAVVEILPAA